ncbi:c-type cytochrome biogenesis protein CcmI [Sneathiella glossodoripedis]|uniref:c-type cytochrome biogenesis protein CcmI n=1 Tax=Sneathiella glossodoripedis TaxID=418853 RepID=UPI00046EA108|nr:c-type cytochrome biogenesis protein CcmI [Sneathiella glossodoripedis]
MIWVVLVIISLIALTILLLPFFRPGGQGENHKLEGLDVYKSQLAELDADISRGVLSEEEAEPVRLEVQRRILKASRSGSLKSYSGGPQFLLAIAIASVVLVGSFSLYFMTGSPHLPSKPLAERNIDQEKRDLAGQDLNSLVKRLAEKLQENPENIDGWVLLARTLSRMERFEDAAKTYLQATRLAPKDAELFVGAAENFYYLAGGTVSEVALENFKKAYQIDPLHPGARYYLAVYEAQNGNLETALEQWMELYQDSASDAPFMPLLRERIERSAKELDRDISDLLASNATAVERNGPTRAEMEAAAEMSAADRQEMIENMVAGLAERMRETPEFDGLMRLGKAYATQQKFQLSASAYEQAARLQPQNVEPLVMQALSLIRGNQSKEPPTAAIEIYRRVLALDDSVAEAHWYVGVSEALAGNSKQAKLHWQRMLELVPTDSTLHANVTEAIKSLSQNPRN